MCKTMASACKPDSINQAGRLIILKVQGCACVCDCVCVCAGHRRNHLFLIDCFSVRGWWLWSLERNPCVFGQLLFLSFLEHRHIPPLTKPSIVYHSNDALGYGGIQFSTTMLIWRCLRPPTPVTTAVDNDLNNNLKFIISIWIV